MASRLDLISGGQYFNATSRNAFAGAKAYTYEESARTTNKATYTDAAAGTARANPIIADANGVFPETYGTGGYFIDIYSSDDSTLIYQADNVYPTQPDAGGSGFTEVATVAALQALDTGTFTSAKTLGATATNDGGQASYYYDSSSTLTGDTVAPFHVVTPDVGSGRWLILPAKRLATGWMPLGSKDGLTLTNGTDADHDVNIAVGSVMDSTQAHLMTLNSAFVKQIDATFAVGTALGGLSDDDSLSTSTWYGVWLLSKSTDTLDCDVILATTKAKSLSDAVATAAGFDISRLIGAVYADASSNIRPWVKGGENTYIWDVMIDTSVSPSTGGELKLVFAPPNHIARLMYSITSDDNTVGYGLITAPSQTDTAPNSGTYMVAVDATGDAALGDAHNTIITELPLNSSWQVRHRESAGVAAVVLRTQAWIFDPTVTDLV